MKKIHVLLTIFFACFTLNAQSQLTFNDIPIVGDANNFALKLRDKGYTIEESSDNIIYLTGSFYGYDNVVVVVAGTPKTNTVYRVSVFFNQKDSFSNLETQYQFFLIRYTNKYGEPESSHSFFEEPYYKGDGNEMEAVRQDKCHYVSFFRIKEGIIALEISKMQRVAAHYEDSEGSKIFIKESN